MAVELAVRLGRLALRNPVLVAAGTVGYGVEFRRAMPLDRLGGLITKTITVEPRQGNPPPRLVETPAGMLNSVGLQNVGLEAFLRDKLPHLAELEVPVIVSVLGETLGEIKELCGRLDKELTVSAIELNLSCPNLPHRHEADNRWRFDMIAQDPEATFDVVSAARQSTNKPLIAKLSPDVTDPRPIAQAAERAGAEALSLVNTFTGMSLDPITRRSRLGSLTGGLSGPAIRPLAVYRVWLVRQAVRCPIIGLGGIVTAAHAMEFFLAGASAVAIGTATFAHPASAIHVLKGLTRLLERQRYASIHDVIGAVETSAHA